MRQGKGGVGCCVGMAKFAPIEFDHNEFGWGPTSAPELFTDVYVRPPGIRSDLNNLAPLGVFVVIVSGKGEEGGGVMVEGEGEACHAVGD
eukprot:COSAG02_NODE_16573_length_1073_cov_1.599589_2_plen_90_part_00